MKAILRISILSTILFFQFSILHAANYYWVGGSGNWSDYNAHWATHSGGQVFWNHVPTPDDTVIFDSLSFPTAHDTVYADNNVYCHSMKWLHCDSMPIITAAGAHPVLRIYGSLQLDSTTEWSYNSMIIFCSVDSGNTITTLGKQMNEVSFAGDTTATWALIDSFRVAYLYFSSGNFYSNGQTIITSIYEQTSGNLSRQYLDTTTLYCQRYRTWGNPILLDADSATVVVSGDSMQAGGFYFHKIVMLGISVLSDNNKIDSLFIHTNTVLAGSDTVGWFQSTRPGIIVTLGGNLTVTDTMIFNGACSGMSALTALQGTSINLLYSNPVFSTLYIDGLTANGNPIVYNGESQNATGWNITSAVGPRTLYWVNNGGNWSDTLHWSASTGGTGNECAPTPIDSVIFDANSFSANNETVTADDHITLCGDMIWNGASGTPSVTQDTGYAMIFGCMKLQSPLQSFLPTVMMRSNSVNTIVDPQGNQLGTVSFSGNGSFTQQSTMHAYTLNFLNGDYVSNGNLVTASEIFSYPGTGTTIDFTGSTVVTGKWFAGISSLAQLITPPSLTAAYFYDAGPRVYHDLYSPSHLTLVSGCTFETVIASNGADIGGSNQFDSLIFTGNDIQIRLSSGSTQTITGDLQINSSCATPVELEASVQGSQAYISKASGVINCDYLVMQDIYGIGGATFNATNTCAISNVSGWNVTPPPALPMYWIGGTGNWNDPAHWSYSSGGSPAGCIPHPLTDVYFDNNSFIGFGNYVMLNTQRGFCHTMDWTGAMGSPHFDASSSFSHLDCYGSMILDQGVNTNGVNLYMRSQSGGNTIQPQNAQMGNLTINGLNGSWDLTDTIGCDTLFITYGTLRTNGNPLHANTIISQEVHPRALLLDSSVVTAGSLLLSPDTALLFNADSAYIIANGETFDGGRHYFHKVSLQNNITLISSDTFGILRAEGNVTLNAAAQIDTLFLNAAGCMIRLGQDTIHVDSAIIAASSQSAFIGLQAASPVDRAHLFKSSDTVCLEFMIMQGIDASGGATFYAGEYSSDVNNNSGWNWHNCNPDQVYVWPGDANNDLTANNLDILSIGIAYGETGYARPSASLNWIAQPNDIWSRVFADSTDIVHADCDGDGIIGQSDTTAVSLNYGLIHPAMHLAPPQEAVQTGGAELKTVITQAVYQAGDTVTIPIWLGTQNNPVNNGYGIAFTLHWDHPFVEPGTMEFDYGNSWFAASTGNIHLEKQFLSSMYCDFGISRITHTDTSGGGELVLMRFVLSQNAAGPLKFWFTDEKLIDHIEDTLPMIQTGGTINAMVGIEETLETDINVFPNPATDLLSVYTNLSGAGTISFYDASGRIVRTQSEDDLLHFQSDISGLAPGIYTMIIAGENTSAVYLVQKL